jgi:hypothetical protein
MKPDAVAKIAMLTDSVRCLTFGLLGLLPLVGLPFILLALSMAIPVFGLIGFFSLAGLPFAVLALWIGGRVRVREKQYWNAAKPFRIWGVLFGGAGVAIWAVVACLILYNLDTGLWYHANSYND